MKMPFAKKSSIDDLRAAIVSGEADLIAAEREVENTAAARAAALLDDDEGVALRADDEARRAALRRDRAAARLDAARAALAEAEEAATAAKRAAERAALDRANEALRPRIEEFLVETATKARGLIGAIEEQRAAARRFNATLAPGEERVADPEGFRAVRGEPEETIAETIGDEWVEVGADRPLTPAAAAEVTAMPGGRSGWRKFVGGHRVQVEKRRVRRRVVRERTQMVQFEPIAAALAIPGLLATDRPGWRPTEPDLVTTALAALHEPPRKAERATRDVIEVVDE